MLNNNIFLSIRMISIVLIVNSFKHLLDLERHTTYNNNLSNSEKIDYTWMINAQSLYVKTQISNSTSNIETQLQFNPTKEYSSRTIMHKYQISVEYIQTRYILWIVNLSNNFIHSSQLIDTLDRLYMLEICINNVI